MRRSRPALEDVRKLDTRSRRFHDRQPDSARYTAWTRGWPRHEAAPAVCAPRHARQARDHPNHFGLFATITSLYRDCPFLLAPLCFPILANPLMINNQ